MTKKFKNLHAGAKPRALIHVLFTFVFPFFLKNVMTIKVALTNVWI